MSPAPSLRLESVHFSHRDSLPILVDVSLDLHVGWTALIGPNGSGKTTLLRLMAGELSPNAGHIAVSPSGARRLWCRQTAESCKDEIRSFAAASSGGARRWLGRLRLDPELLERWPTLSPGERRRWQIGAALAAEPSLLLLDEPTDHLDADARGLLIDALRRFDGVGVLVSHDRALLSALATATARIHASAVELRHTGFEQAREAWHRENEERREARQKLLREQRRQRRRLGRKRADLKSAEAKIKTSRRARGRRDSDQRTMAARNRARSGAARLGRDVALLRDQVERTDGALEITRFDKERGGRVALPFEPAPTDPIAWLRTDRLEAGGQPLLRDVSLEVRRSTRAWIRGDNGSGKTTLLRRLLASVRLPEERILYLPQELGDAQVTGLVRRVHGLADEKRGRLLSLCGALGADPERLLASQLPSPGEARKLAIAFGLAHGVAAAFLDEPTNHLDLPAIDRLESALAEYPGAVLVVSHDDALAAACTREVWTLAGGFVRVSGR